MLWQNIRYTLVFSATKPRVANRGSWSRMWSDRGGDAHDGRLPLLVIDGRQIDWDEFGRMLMSFEGSQFKLHIADKSEEL
jgi:hypothetical protein